MSEKPSPTDTKTPGLETREFVARQSAGAFAIVAGFAVFLLIASIMVAVLAYNVRSDEQARLRRLDSDGWCAQLDDLMRSTESQGLIRRVHPTSSRPRKSPVPTPPPSARSNDDVPAGERDR